jgi:hypothetical protein
MVNLKPDISRFLWSCRTRSLEFASNVLDALKSNRCS